MLVVVLVLVLVLVGVLVLVAAVPGDAGVLAVPAAAVLVEVADPPDELPQAASSAMSGSRARRFMGTVTLGTPGGTCHYPDGHGP